MKATPLGLRLFLEGVEIPVISAQVSIQPDAPAASAIQVVPTDMGLYLLPRTLVHLFYLDTDLVGEETAEVKKFMKEHRGTVSVENSAINRFEAGDAYYKILFAGEVIGLQFSKSTSARQLVLQCMDLSSYWDACYQFFSDYSRQGDGLTDTTHQFAGADAGLFDNVAGGHDWVISRLLETKPQSPAYQKCEGLQGGLIHLLEAVGGVKHRGPGVNAGYNGVNDFFSIAELRYNLLGMLGAIEEDKTSAKLYAGKAFRNWLQNGMTSLGSLLSFRDIVNHVNKYIFHNIYPNPCAFYVAPSEEKKSKMIKIDTSIFTDSSVGKLLLSKLKKAHETLGQAIQQLQSSVDYNVLEDYRDGITSVQYVRGFLNEALAIAGTLQTDDKVEAKAQVLSALSALKVVGADPLEVSAQVIIRPSDDDIESEIQTITESYKLIEGFIGPLYRTKKKSKKTVEVEIGGHLYNQLFLPETFFVSPPRCNVIFPDQYFQFSYSRNFAREVTRLSCQGGLGILAGGKGSKILGHHYFAPNIKDVRGKTLYATLSAGARVLLPHEVHSGIIPKFEWVTDGHRWGLKASVKGAEATQAQKINYLQRLANFQFFLHRWSSRNMELAGIFMPNLVAGFPSVVIDRSAPSSEVLAVLEKALGRRMLPTQFMGKIVGLTHSVSQQGGSTSVSFAYCRTHRGLDDEFLGTLSKEEVVLGEPKTIIIYPKYLAVNETYGGTDRNLQLRLLRLHFKSMLKTAVLPDVGKVKQVIESGSTALRREEFLMLFGGIVSTVLNYSIEIPENGDEFDAYLWGNPGKKTVDQEGSMQISSSPDQDGTEDAISYPEKITVTYLPWVKTGKFVQGMAFEDAVRPEWMTKEVWDNKNITKSVYKPLLGTVAVTDDIGIGQAQQDELLKRSTTDEGLLRELFSSNEEALTSAELSSGIGKGAGTVSVETMPGDDSKIRYFVLPGSIEETIDGLSIVYGMIKQRGEGVHEFIREYGHRPVASMIDVLGSQNLAFGPDGWVLPGPPAPGEPPMIEGFHSRAFGDYNVNGKDSLAVLFPGEPNPTSVMRSEVMDRGKAPESVNAKLDPRGRARARVQAYLAELRISRGLLSQ